MAAGILRPLYRRALMAQQGPFLVTTVTAQSTHGEALSHVIAALLLDDDLDRNRMVGRYLYVADGDQAGHQARIRALGYHGAGALVEITRRLAAPLAPGTTIEISAGLPAEQYLDTKGGNQLVNEALARCDIEYRQTLTGDGTRSMSLADYEAFIDRNDRADAVYDDLGYAAAEPLETAAFSPRVAASGAARTLVTDIAYSSGNAVELRVIRAGHTLIKSGSSWGTSAVGLTSDAQAAAVPIPWVVAAGMGKALAAQIAVIRHDTAMSPQEKQAAIAEIENGQNGLRYWRAVFARIVNEQFPKPGPHRRDARTFPAAVVTDPWSQAGWHP